MSVLPWKFRRISFFLLLICSLALLPGNFYNAALAAPVAPVKMDVKAGLDSYYKENQWLPVQVTLTSDGSNSPPVNGRVEVSFASYAPDSVLYQRDVNLIAPYRKTFWIYALAPRTIRNVQVRLVSNDGSVLAETQKDITPLGDGNFLVGVISDNSSALNFLNNADLAQPYRSSSAFLYGYYASAVNAPLTNRIRANIAHLSSGDLPDNPAGLSALDALVIGDLDTTNLGAGIDQETLANTVDGWLAGGRALVVAGDSGLRKAGALANVLPVSAASAPETIPDLSPLENFVKTANPNASGPADRLQNITVASVQLEPKAPGVTSLIPPSGQPGNGPLLLASRAYGLGTSWFLATELRPLQNWNWADDLWQAIFKDYQPRLDYATAARRTQAGNEWSYRINPNPNVKDNSDPAILIVFLAVYLLLVGPLTYFLLKRWDRRELAWLVVPAISAVFTVGAVIIGSGGLEKDIVVSRAAIVTLGQGNDGKMRGLSTGLATLYSNKRNEFNLDVGENVVFSASFGDRYFNNPGQANTSNVVRQGPGAGYSNLFLSLQQRRSYGFEADAGNLVAGGIVADAHLVNGKLEGTLENTTNREWDNVIVFVPSGTVQNVGTLKAKEKKAIPPDAATPGVNIVETLVNSGTAQLQVNYNSRAYPVDLVKLRNVDGKLVPDPDFHRAMLLESYFGATGEGLPAGNNRFYLIGWSPKAELPFSIDSRSTSTYDLTLLFEGVAYR